MNVQGKKGFVRYNIGEGAGKKEFTEGYIGQSEGRKKGFY